MKLIRFATALSLSTLFSLNVALAVPIFNFDDSANTDNYLNIDNFDKIQSTFEGVTVSLGGDFLNPSSPGIALFAYNDATISVRDVLVRSSFASGNVSSLESPASGGVFTISSGNSILLQASLGTAELNYGYVGTTGPQNDPVYVLRYDTSDLTVFGGIYASYFAAGGFNGFLDLVFDNANNGYLEFAGGSLYGASNNNCAVPEPTSMALLGMGGIAILKRRKRA